MSEQNKALARRWFEEVWNQGRESTIDELFHPQGKACGFPDPDSVLVGPEGFKAVHRQFNNAFTNLHIDIHDLIAEETASPSAGPAPPSTTATASAFPPPEKRPPSSAPPL
jgi:hypothetical protein